MLDGFADTLELRRHVAFVLVVFAVGVPVVITWYPEIVTFTVVLQRAREGNLLVVTEGVENSVHLTVSLIAGFYGGIFPAASGRSA